MFKDFLDSYSRTLIMGILNITPDSFYDGGKYLDQKSLKNKFDFLNKSDIIDIGAESSRPGASKVDEITEINRISSILSFLDKKNMYYSIDTYKPNVADFAIKNGFNMINDITGGSNPKMLKIVSEANIPIILMHMKGKPANMQNNPRYNNIVDDLLSFFENRIEFCLRHGINKKQIIIDPGIGFGKTISDNDKIIRHLNKFKTFDIPILIGLSRKSFLSIKNDKPIDRLEASLAVSSIAINNGADIIRVHDVEKSRLVFSIIDRLINKNI
jgi:dihydropteroate synthase